MTHKKKLTEILFMGTYPPRECGIATFTKDLATAVQNQFFSSVTAKVIALNNDITKSRNYPEEVIFQIDETDIGAYVETAKRINETDAVKVVNVQHEFGIYGGEYGSHLIRFLEMVKKPIVVTLHTVLPHPNEGMRKTVQRIAENSNCLVVMNSFAVDILRNDYGLKDTKIDVIPHGIPSVPFVPSAEEKADLGVKDMIVLFSFGMMNRGKGYEYVIRALPKVIEKHPNVMYVIVGETHPVIRKNEGEIYRNYLEGLVKELGLSRHVKFYNKYVQISEIIKYLQATDVYISSSINPDQIVSGTLSYAMGCGRVVVSTPFLHAREMVTADKGILVEFNNPDSFANAILQVLSDQKARERMEHNTYTSTRKMIWPNVALSYMNVFRRYAHIGSYDIIPRIKLDHLIALTDENGIVQFAKNTKPDMQYGYSIDDNARALIVCCKHHDRTADTTSLKLARIYLGYIERMLKDGKFYNFADAKMRPNLKDFSEDAHGRAMWALGHLTASPVMPKTMRDKAQKLFLKGLPESLKMKSPRAVAYNIKAIYCYNKINPSDTNIDRIHKLADHLVSIYKDNKSDDWQWFEPYFTYANARIPEALYLAYWLKKKEEYLKVAEKTLKFLMSHTTKGNKFNPVGHNGWFIKHCKRAYFDQQPIEASTMVKTLMTAHKVTGNNGYKKKAYAIFSWFHGNNHLNQTLYDKGTGGCYDGLGNHTININQGAESTIAYLLARLTIKTS